MVKEILYFMSPSSPYCYMGGPRLAALAARAGARVSIKPIDASVSFPATGGLPVAKRHPSRLAYRLVELARWRDHWGLAMNIEPKFFPVEAQLASRMIIAQEQAGEAALELSNAILRTVWEGEGNIANGDTLAAIAHDCGLDGAALLERAASEQAESILVGNTEAAIAAGVFGVPWLVFDGTPYWGQDRLDFLARALGL